MFNRFTTDARVAVIMAQELALAEHASVVDVVHVAVGVIEAEGTVLDALREAGSSPEDVRLRLMQHAGDSGLDEAALASLGIDFDAVNRAAEMTFGEGALERAGVRARLRGRKRAHIPFAKNAKKAIRLSLREASRLSEKEISDRHLLLGVLGADDRVAEILQSQVERGKLRALLETQPHAA